jgi:hypothetical protein
MNAARPADHDLSTLSLQFQVLDDRPDWPVAAVMVNGQDPFAEIAKDWRGFDPAEILGPHSPLYPVGHGRRVAVYRCSCGEAGCGVIAPLIVTSPDGRRVSWVDFRDYTGVFIDPVSEWAREDEGRLWNLPDLHFDREQYLAEVERASRDQSWETPRRRTARLLFSIIRPRELILPPDLELAWTSPAWSEDGVTVVFQHFQREPRPEIRQELLRLTSAHIDPEDAAGDMAEQLLSTAPVDWVSRFGWQPV